MSKSNKFNNVYNLSAKRFGVYLNWLLFILIAPCNKCSGALNVIELVIKVVFLLHMHVCTCENDSLRICMRATFCTGALMCAQIAKIALCCCAGAYIHIYVTMQAYRWSNVCVCACAKQPKNIYILKFICIYIHMLYVQPLSLCISFESIFIHYSNLINLNFCVFKLAAAVHELYLRSLHACSCQPFLSVVCAKVIKMSLITSAHISAQRFFFIIMLLCSCVCHMYLIFLRHIQTGCQTCRNSQLYSVAVLTDAFAVFSAANVNVAVIVHIFFIYI